MKILSYYQLKVMPQTVPARKEKPYFINKLDLQTWQNELVAVLGPRASCKLIFEKIFWKAGMVSSNIGAGFLFEKFFSQSFSSFFLNSSETLHHNIYEALGKAQPVLSKTERMLLTNKYLDAAYLQTYSLCKPVDLSKTLQKQAVLAILFASAGQLIMLPDLFNQGEFAEKALLQRALHNLRLMQQTKKTIFIQTQQPDEALYLADRIVIATSEKINSIGDVIPVSFNQSRNRWIIKEIPAFKNMRKYLTKLLTHNFANEDTFSFMPSQLIS